MSKIEQCRDVKQLNSICRCLLELSLGEIEKQGINPLVVETYRSKERQYYLYCQGRTVAQAVNAGVPGNYAKAYSNPTATQVTWTLNSIHTQKNAVDVIPQRKIGGKMTAIWNAADPATRTIIRTMEKYGFEAGANWTKSPDSPHFQLKGIDANGTTINAKNTNNYLTKMVQKALNKKIEAGLKVDGVWGSKTTEAVNQFRANHGWNKNGKLATTALKTLLN